MYLRSFADEGNLVSGTTAYGMVLDPTTLDDAIAAPLKGFGPVMALRNPVRRDTAPPYGSPSAPRDDWKSEVTRLVERSQAVVVLVGMGEGLSWEFNLLATSGSLSRTLLVFPPVRNESRQNRWNAFLHSRDDDGTLTYQPDEQEWLGQWFASQLGNMKDEGDEKELAVAVSFEDRLTPRIHVEPGSGPLEYEKVIGEAVSSIVGEPASDQAADDGQLPRLDPTVADA